MAQREHSIEAGLLLCLGPASALLLQAWLAQRPAAVVSPGCTLEMESCGSHCHLRGQYLQFNNSCGGLRVHLRVRTGTVQWLQAWPALDSLPAQETALAYSPGDSMAGVFGSQ